MFEVVVITEDGITPACAGKSFGFPSSRLVGWDHPRVCGEKCFPLSDQQRFEGSPPRVRGKVVHGRGKVGPRRITPACAGKSCYFFSTHTKSPDHPRVCGEKGKKADCIRETGGSPPRVRGKGSASWTVNRKQRITPACAGKRLKKAHKIKDFDPVPIRFHLVFRRFERWCSNLPTLDENVPV